MKINAKSTGAAGAAIAALTAVGVTPEFAPQLFGALAPIINRYDLNTITVAVLVALGAVALAVSNRLKIEKLEDRLSALEGAAGHATPHSVGPTPNPAEDQQ